MAQYVDRYVKVDDVVRNWDRPLEPPTTVKMGAFADGLCSVPPRRKSGDETAVAEHHVTVDLLRLQEACLPIRAIRIDLLGDCVEGGYGTSVEQFQRNNSGGAMIFEDFALPPTLGSS